MHSYWRCALSGTLLFFFQISVSVNISAVGVNVNRKKDKSPFVYISQLYLPVIRQYNVTDLHWRTQRGDQKGEGSNSSPLNPLKDRSLFELCDRTVI